MPSLKLLRASASKNWLQEQRNNVRSYAVKSLVLSSATLLLLTACATAPTAPPTVVQCPVPPPLELNLPDGALEHDFIETMRQFLQGNLPLQPSYSLPSEPVSPTGLRLNAN